MKHERGLDRIGAGGTRRERGERAGVAAVAQVGARGGELRVLGADERERRGPERPVELRVVGRRLGA